MDQMMKRLEALGSQGAQVGSGTVEETPPQVPHRRAPLSQDLLVFVV